MQINQVVGSVLFSTAMIAFVHYKQWADLQTLKNRKAENVNGNIRYVTEEEDEPLTPQQRANWEELKRQQTLKHQLDKD